MSDRARVVVTDYIEPDLAWEREQLEELGAELSAHQLKDADAATIVDAAAGAEVLIVNMAPIDGTVLRGLDACELVIRHGAGYDNVDVEVAAEQDIAVAKIPDYCVHEVAEQALMLLLACQRQLPGQLQSLTRSTGAEQWDFSPVGRIHSLQDKTLAVIGAGRIGSTLLDLASGLGMRRIAVDPRGQRRVEGVETVSLDRALEQADAVSLHVPLDDDTHHLIGEPELKAMRSTAVLVNTSRGSVVDLDALDRALNDGQIAAAGIDVYDIEPPPGTLGILDNSRAICTPHLSWRSEESSWRIRELIIEDVRRHLAGKPPRYPVAP